MSLSRSGSLTWSSSASSLSRRGLPGAFWMDFAPLSEYLSRLFGLVIGPLSSVLLVPWAYPDIRGQVTLKLLAMGCFAAHSSSETPGVVDITKKNSPWPPRCSTYWLGPDSAWHLGQVLSGYPTSQSLMALMPCTRNIFDFCIVAVSATGDESLACRDQGLPNQLMFLGFQFK